MTNQKIGNFIGSAIETPSDQIYGVTQKYMTDVALHQVTSFYNLDTKREMLYALKLLEHYTWFEGSTIGLKRFYQDLGLSYFEGIGVDQRLFWKKVPDKNRAITVGAARTISNAMGNLLFSTGVFVDITKKEDLKKDEQEKHDKRVATLKSKWEAIQAQRKLYECAIQASWAGTAFIKWDYDEKISNLPLMNVVHPFNARVFEDGGIPFRFDFFEKVSINKVDYKIIEVRELRKFGEDKKLVISSFLTKYKGMIHNFEELSELRQQTNDLKPIIKELKKNGFDIDFNKEIIIETDDLLAVSIVNKRPDPITKSSCYGASDFYGLVPILDALDEVFSTWMEVVRKGKPKRYIPEIFLRRDDQGRLTEYDDFDIDFVTLSAQAEGIKEGTGAIQTDEGTLDVDVYTESYNEIFNDLIIKCGLTPYTIGRQGTGLDGRDLSDRRERFSQKTREVKRQIWEPVLNTLIRQFVILDKLYNKKSNKVLMKDVSEYYATLKAYHIPTIEGRIDLWGDARRNGTCSVRKMVDEIYLDMSAKEKEDMVEEIRAENRLDSPEEKKKKQKNREKNIYAAAGRFPQFEQQDVVVPNNETEKNTEVAAIKDPKEKNVDKENKGDNKAKGIAKKENKGI